MSAESDVLNPIIPGFAPDPSVVLVDGTYFLVNSTFHLFPGLPIYTSKDLVHWNLIGNAINRPGQLSLAKSSTTINYFDNGDHLLATGGLYAPTIRYNNGTFYIVCTNVVRNGSDGAQDELQNFIVSTTDIYSNEWSDPVYFDFYGIDPSLFFDRDGKAYICGSKSPGPSTRIMLFEVDLGTGTKLTEEEELWNGTGGIYPEGPHIYFRNGFYYLMIAEGGTHEGHSVTMARSRDIRGPYEPSPENPILTASKSDEYVQCTGHCEAFEGKNGEWWGVCLGVRMAAELLYGLGRETFLTKGRWTDEGWLKFERVKTQLLVPGTELRRADRLTSVSDADLLYIRDPVRSRYDMASPPLGAHSPRTITLKSSPDDLTSPEASPTFVGKRQRFLNGTSRVILNIVESDDGNGCINAGLAIYKDEHRFLRIYFSSINQVVRFEVRNKAKRVERVLEHALNTAPNTLELVIDYTEAEYCAGFKVDDHEMTMLGQEKTMELSGKDFVGPIVGLFVFSQDGSAGQAVFEKFCVEHDQV